MKCAAAGGEVHVTLKDKPPYSGWNVKYVSRRVVLDICIESAWSASFRSSFLDQSIGICVRGWCRR